jgi:hypothetical protein
MSRSQPHTLLLGAGYALFRVAQLFRKDEVVLTTRSSEKCDNWQKQGYLAEVFSIRAGGQLRDILDSYPSLTCIVDGVPPLLSPDLRGTTHYSQGASPGWLSETLFGVKNVATITADYPNIQRLVYLSTTGVFGVTDGSWVDEQTPTRADSLRITARIESESLYRATDKEVVVLRPSAIYGADRGLVVSLRNGTFQHIKGERWTNRIHVDDLADVIKRIIQHPSAGLPPLLCVTDDEPALMNEVVEFVCSNYGTPKPVPITLEEARQRGLLTLLGNQRVSNKRLRQQLSISLIHPSYKHGFL